jgi:peptidoglycan/xylan/chitin deacetylase (PgdA/CDA1 family)
MKYILALTALLLSFVVSPASAESVAITMDNPNTGATPYLTAEQRDLKILAVLQRHHLKAVLFVQGSQVDSPEGAALLQRWNKAGHTLGNHTYSHKMMNEVTEKQYEADTLRAEKLLLPYSHFKKIFRFPFLKEGETVERYLTGSVTIDASDWYISDRLEKRLTENPKADITAYKKYYLAYMWSRAQYYDELAKAVLHRSPRHTLLVHHNLLNALFLDDLIQMFKDKGWDVIAADVAFKDPVFQIQPNTVPAGESLIWALAKQTGRYENVLRYPGEDGAYEKATMDKLGL